MQFFERAHNAVREGIIDPLSYTGASTIRNSSIGFLGGGFFGAVSGLLGSATFNIKPLLKGEAIDEIWLATRMNAAGDSLLGFCVGMIVGVNWSLIQGGYIEDYTISSYFLMMLIIGLPLAGSAIGNQLLRSETPKIGVEESIYYAGIGGLAFCLAWFALSKLNNIVSQCWYSRAVAVEDRDNDPIVPQIV